MNGPCSLSLMIRPLIVIGKCLELFFVFVVAFLISWADKADNLNEGPWG